ncbi:RNA polymerase subunit sigma-70 [Paramicrobacterium fandaimingii]|uniref:RNA polymerase subunit sigma-70 n=1 Tax=Paramicrobacterium fandaimingii TaxID=2708079 RepID=UPI001421466A|nr:RNA polymerase subunit sigma-70 [Microbacterium fandaimingii]
MSTTSDTGSGVTIDDLERHRGPLTGYCYRMLGGAADTDDAVQETLIRGLRIVSSYDPERARLSTWLHRIATNVCIDMLRATQRRALAMDLGPSSDFSNLGAPLSPDRFVEPMSDSRLFGVSDPAERVVGRESVRLAFIVALQRLAPRQRAVLLLRDVLGFSAQESAEILERSTASVNSALQRARARLAADPPARTDEIDPENASQRELLERYVVAFESHDVDLLTSLLREDVMTSMPPFAWWVSGAERIAVAMTSSDACKNDRLLPTAINGSPGFGQYRPDDRGRLRPFAITLLELRDNRVSHICTFLGSGARFAEFGLPDHLDS